MVKVGDRVKIVLGGGGYTGYETGDVLEVIALNVGNPKDIYVRIPKNVGYTGGASDRPIEQPFAYLIEPEYEVVESEDNPMIKVGDKVKLIDKFYKHEAFKRDSRHIRKQIASLKDRDFKVKYISKITDRVSIGEIDYYVPIELLEKAEQLPDKPGFEAGKSYIFDKTLLERKPRPDSWESDIDGKSVEFIPGNTKGIVGVYVVERRWCREAEQLPEKPNPGDLFRVIGNSGVPHYFENGEIVTLVKPFGWTYDCICNGYCKYHGGVYDQVIRISDIEPYTKYRYTDEQIAEAQRIIGEIVASLPDWNNYAFSRHDNITFMYKNDQLTNRGARCSKTDEYNQTIGRMIALCRHVGRPLPEWL